MKRVVAVLVAALGVSAAAPQDSKSAISWAKTWSDAVAEATIRNVPIFFTVHKDG